MVEVGNDVAWFRDAHSTVEMLALSILWFVGEGVVVDRRAGHLAAVAVSEQRLQDIGLSTRRTTAG